MRRYDDIDLSMVLALVFGRTAARELIQSATGLMAADLVLVLFDQLAKELAIRSLIRMSRAAALVAEDVLNAGLGSLMLAMGVV